MQNIFENISCAPYYLHIIKRVRIVELHTAMIKLTYSVSNCICQTIFFLINKLMTQSLYNVY